MLVVTFQTNANCFLKNILNFFNLNFLECVDLDDLQAKMIDVKENKFLLIYKYHTICENFLDIFTVLEKQDKNVICTYQNIKVEGKDKIIPYQKYQNTELILPSKILSFTIKKNDLLNLLENKNIKTYIDLANKVNFKYICKNNLTVNTEIKKNLLVVSKNERVLFQDFRNIESFNLALMEKKNYYLFLENPKVKTNNVDLIVKIYNNTHELNLSNIFLFLNTNQKNEILKEFIKNPLNNKYNNLYVIGTIANNYKLKINCHVINVENFEKQAVNLFSNMINNYDVYFIDTVEKIKDVTQDPKNLLIYDKLCKNYNILKINSIFLKFTIVEVKCLKSFLVYMADFSLIYLFQDLFIINKPIQINYKPKIFVPEVNLELIDYLYEHNLYDDCCYLINFIIKFRLSYNNSFIYKTLVLIDKVNYIISASEIESLVNLLEFENFSDLFDICYVLFFKHIKVLSQKKLLKYISENIILKEELPKFLILVYYFELLKNEIDLVKDKYLVVSILENFNYLEESIEKVTSLDDGIKIKNLYAEILVFLNNRFDLITDCTFKIKINHAIQKLIFDFNNFDKIEEEKVIEKFFEYPELVISGCNSLSDFMMSEEDINLKRRNLFRLTYIINKNWDKYINKFNNIVNNGDFLKLHSLFRFSYHGLVNKDLFINNIKVIRNVLKLKIEKEITNDEDNLFLFEKKKTNSKKICFLSNFLTRKHSVFKDRHQVILNLIKKGFEVYLAIFGKLNFTYSKLYSGIKEVIDLSNMTSYNIVKKMRGYEFDKLVFCEIGMDNRVVNIAHFRMANKQYNTWGHSDTSGFEEIDYFVSSELYELPYEESKEHYSEKLILQKGMSTCYVNPTKNYKLNLSRTFYGLSDFEKIICCPQSLFKIHPKFDRYIFEILKRNQDVSLVFLNHAGNKNKMYERWNKILKDMPQYYGVLSRVKFIPAMDHEKFCNLMKVSDVMIDPYPFGGCNSSLESFSLGKPLVTQPSIRINGRFTYGFYKRMGFMDLVANNMEEYVSLTTKLLQDKEFHQEMTDKILANKDKLFMDQQTLDEWEELMAAE